MFWCTALVYAADPAAPPEDHLLDTTELVVDAKLPAEVLLEGVKLAQLYFPAEVRWKVEVGEHLARVYTNGNPVDVPITLVAGVTTKIVVGRSGVTTERLDRPEATGPAKLELRMVGAGGAVVRLDREAHHLDAGGRVELELPSGSHPMSVRSADGTVIWAAGALDVYQGEVLVMIAEGRLPEVSGTGAFHAGGG
ncbi:MAG: hypothetical protein ABMA64_06970 [Myxococcota bacterium]